MSPRPPGAQPAPGMCHEEFRAFGRADSRDELMAIMRAQAESYFGGPVGLRDASAQLVQMPTNIAAIDGARSPRYQGSSRWYPRPKLPPAPAPAP